MHERQTVAVSTKTSNFTIIGSEKNTRSTHSTMSPEGALFRTVALALMPSGP